MDESKNSGIKITISMELSLGATLALAGLASQSCCARTCPADLLKNILGLGVEPIVPAVSPDEIIVAQSDPGSSATACIKMMPQLLSTLMGGNKPKQHDETQQEEAEQTPAAQQDEKESEKAAPLPVPVQTPATTDSGNITDFILKVMTDPAVRGFLTTISTIKSDVKEDKP